MFQELRKGLVRALKHYIIGMLYQMVDIYIEKTKTKQSNRILIISISLVYVDMQFIKKLYNPT